MSKPRYVIQWDAQPVYFCKTMCSLLESQFLVDMTLISNSYSLKVHKCVMAAVSPYFREQLQKEPSIDKVVMNGVKHTVLKALIEFIYCGEASVNEENMYELIAVANYFELKGLKAILPHKIGITCNENKDLLLQIKPPVFFCKNEKVRSVRHNSYMSDILYGDGDVKVVLEANNYQVFDPAKRRTQPSSVVDEAHVALAKEEAASRFALQMLQKDLNVTSNLFVIEDTCTEATVETSLTTQFEESNTITSEDANIIQNDIPETPNLSEAYKLQNLDMKIDKDEKVELEINKSKCNEKIKECLQILQNDLPSDFPILYKSSDGNYINVTSEMFKNLAQTGTIHYQVVHEDGHIGDFQQYICNDFSDDINVNQEKLNEECQIPKENEPMTLKQLVAETVTPDYSSSEKTYLENMNPNLTTMISVSGLTSDQTIVDEIPHHTSEELTDIPFNNFILNEKDSISFVPQENEMITKNLGGIVERIDGNTMVSENIILNETNVEKVLTTPLKRKRGRPRKIKMESEPKEPPVKICEKNIKERNIKFDEFAQSVSIEQNHLEDKQEIDDEKFRNQMNSNYIVMCGMDDQSMNKLETEEVKIIENEEGIKNEEIRKNPIFNLISLNNDIPYAVGLLPLGKNDKRSPKSKRRYTRSSNKENLEIQE